jgi:hypothetical protein
MSEPERFIVARKRLGELNEALLVDLLAKRQYREFIYGLAYLTDLDIRTAQRIFYDPGCEALAIACKAKNFKHESFATLLAHTKKGGGSKEVDTVELLELYRTLDVADAERTMRFWRVRASQSAAPAAPAAPSRELAAAV